MGLSHTKEAIKDYWTRILSQNIQRGKVKLQFNSLQQHSISQMSSQFTNNYMTAPTSLNLYITRKLNNMDKAKLFKKEHDNWTQLYHKILKGLEAIINVQKQAKNIMKIAEETDITITESERTILKVSINNQTINAMNILGILENLQYLIQSNMED